MSPFKGPFESMAWQQVRHDVRQKLHFIPDGADSRHRAVAITPGTQLLMIEDVAGV